LPELEALAQRAAFGGLLIEDDADRVGESLGRLRDALGAVHRCLAWLRESRPREVIVVELDEELGLLAPVPERVDPIWLNGVVRSFEMQHQQSPTRLLVASLAALPLALRQAAEGRLTVIEDEKVRPGLARLVV